MVYRLIINMADASAVAIVHAGIHAKRLSNNEVAAHHVDVRALQRRIIYTYRQAGRSCQL